MPRQAAALYLRISLDRTGEGLAVERQREDGERLIALRDWTLAETFTDNDVSAAGGKKRPGFDAMLRAIRAGTVDVVVAWSLDRLTRNRRDQLRLIETCQRSGVNLALVRGSDVDLSSAVGRGVADILSATARMEIEQKSERQVRANLQAAQQGRMVGGRRPFGYTPDGLHFDALEAPLVNQMYQRFLSGSSLGSIARWLNEENVPTTRGNRWRTETVRVVLSNPRNAGLRAMRKPDPHTGRRPFYHDSPIAKANWPEIVPEETWRQTLAVLQDPTRRRTTSTAARHLLSGIAWCGWEGCSRHVLTSYSHGQRTLRCQSRQHVNRRADQIEAFVEDALIRRLRREDAAELFPAPSAQVDLDAIRLKSIGVREKMLEYEADYDAGLLTREEFYRFRARNNDQLAELDKQIAEAGRVDVLAPLRAAVDPEEVWDLEYTPEQRREVMRQWMRVTILPGMPGQTRGVRFQEETVRIEWIAD